jgi:hypothetical protein
MKALSVLLTVALLLVANQGASLLKRAGALPMSTRQTVTNSNALPTTPFTQAGLRTLNGPTKNTF